MAKSNHLRLVPFNPNDYSLGEVLVKATQEPITDAKFIGAALSLAFQWPERTVASIVVPDAAPLSIQLDYDREERSPSELWVRFEDRESVSKFTENSEIQIRFEIFRQCYEFSSVVLANETNPFENDQWHLIIEAPDTLLAYKQRRLPRVVVSPDLKTNLSPCRLIAEDGHTNQELNVLEVGMRAIKAGGIQLNPGTECNLLLGTVPVPARVERIDAGNSIFSLCPTSFEHIGAVFEYYRSVAMPGLRPRSEFPIDKLINLYKESNYFGKFQTDTQLEERMHEIKMSWAAVGTSHEVTADYVIVDQQGEPTGASSASLAFTRDGKPVWALHQLCAKTNPNLLEQSGQLYTWRAEYIAARPEEINVIGWFDSRSRWLERIYVKFAFQKYRLECLYPVSVYRKTYSEAEITGSSANPSTQQVPFGETNRVMHDSHDQIGGFNPRFLNASGVLNAVVDFKQNPPISQLHETAQHMLAFAQAGGGTVEFTAFGEASESTAIDGIQKVDDVDRMFYFRKEGLVDFIASVEHSVAVTLRKKLNGEFGEAV